MGRNGEVGGNIRAIIFFLSRKLIDTMGSGKLERHIPLPLKKHS